MSLFTMQPNIIITYVLMHFLPVKIKQKYRFAKYQGKNNSQDVLPHYLFIQQRILDSNME
jgi:hypothetical protein